MTKKLTAARVLSAVKATTREIITDLKGEDTDREMLIERMDEECDTLWGSLVFHGMITDYDADDLLRAMPACNAILECARDHAWIESDSGLWEGLTYGVVPSMAYFSLRNILYQVLADKGYDSNNDYPFRKAS